MQPENTNKKGVAWSLEPPLFPSFPFWKEGGSGDVVVMNFRINLSNGLVITQWKGLFNISEYFVMYLLRIHACNLGNGFIFKEANEKQTKT